MKMNKRRIIIVAASIILLVSILTGVFFWTRKVTVPKDYVILRATSFVVVRHVLDKLEIVLQLEHAGKDVISSVAYDYANKRIAVAMYDQFSMRGSARILLLSDVTYKKINELRIGSDHIGNMSFDNAGKLAFVSEFIGPKPDSETEYELAYIDFKNNVVKRILRSDKVFFFEPSWSPDSKRIYFAYNDKSGEPDFSNPKAHFVGYIDLDQPSRINKIAAGASICVSDTIGSLAYLDLSGRLFVADSLSSEKRAVSLPSKYLDYRFTRAVRFVKGSNDLILRIYRVAASYKLYLVPYPYTDIEKIMNPAETKGFDVYLEAKSN